MVNHLILVGYLGKDPEVAEYNGVPRAQIQLATKHIVKEAPNGDRIEHTEWHRVIAWRDYADVARKHLRKGSLIYVEGRLQTRSYEKDGERRYVTEVHCSLLRFLDPKNREEFVNGTHG